MSVRTVTDCDLCGKEAGSGVKAFIKRIVPGVLSDLAYAQMGAGLTLPEYVHVCPRCWSRPIADLAKIL